MQNARVWRLILALLYGAILLLPTIFFLQARGGLGSLSGLSAKQLAAFSFPLFGLQAFFLIWGQIMIGSQLRFWRRFFPGILTFHQIEGGAALLLALAHPLLIFLGYGAEVYFARSFVAPELLIWIWLGYVQLSVMLLTVGAALLRRQPWLRTHWRYVHYLNYALFWLVAIHSWNLGSDIRSSGLRYVWFFFCLTVAAVTVLRLRRYLTSGGSLLPAARPPAVANEPPSRR